VRAKVQWTFPHADWPPKPGGGPLLKNLDHSAWALRTVADGGFDLVHVNDAIAVPISRFLSTPIVHTLHHPHDPELSAVYARHPWVHYVSISAAQRARETMPLITTIHHGIRLEDYRLCEDKAPYLAFLGRMAPVKAPHLAIEVARRAGLPLKIAGEIQPVFQEYWDTMVKPHIDGSSVEFLGEATLAMKNDLLGNASALLFPIEWDEPFGLVMIEAMACGTPVVALPGGAVREVVVNGVSGWICEDLDGMAAKARAPGVSARACRRHVEQHFSLERMVADYETLYASCVAPRAPAGARRLPTTHGAD
jgi:glycosyltransferase involved in cell wall biosynthesis